MQSAVIFGGAGFIGTRLARHLTERGVDVTIADLAKPDEQPGYSLLQVDVRQPIADIIPRTPDTTLYLLAAVHRTPGHADFEYFATNVGGARQIADFAERTGIRKIVFTSSVAVYGPDEANKDEDSLPAPTSAYGQSKLAAEQVLTEWQGAGPGRQLVIARPAVVFGPGEHGNFTRLASALRRRMFAYPGRRDTVKGCCYVDDLIDSFDFALGTGQNHFLYNYAYPAPYTIEAICEAFHRSGGLPRPLGALPLRALNAGAMALERLASLGLDTGINRARIAKLTTSTRISPARLLALGYRFPTDLPAALSRWQAEAGAFR